MDGFETLLAAPMLGTNPAGASNLFGGGGDVASGADQFSLFGGVAAQPPPSTDSGTTDTGTTDQIYTPTKPNYLASYDTGAGDLQRLLKSIYTPDDAETGTGVGKEKPPGQDALLHQPDLTQDSGYAQTQNFLKHGQDFVSSYGEGHDQAQGNATTFGLDYGAKVNPDGSVDSRFYDALDNGKGAFGYNTRDPNQPGAALPISVVQNSIGDYTKDPKLFEAIRRGDYKVLVTGADGRREQVPLVDVGSNYLDLTYKTSHDFNTQGKAKMGYQIIGPDGNTVPIKGYHPHDVAPAKFDGHVGTQSIDLGSVDQTIAPGQIKSAESVSSVEEPKIDFQAHDFTKGRAHGDPQYIILHSSDGNEKSGLETLTHGGVSAHYFSTKNSGMHHLVSESDTAYHGGKVIDPKYENANTIGIEQEHVDGKEPWDDTVVRQTAKQVAQDMIRYNIPLDHVIGHSDIAPGRKQDPLNYPWDNFHKYVQEYLGDRATQLAASKPEGEKPVERSAEEKPVEETAEAKPVSLGTAKTEEPPPEEDLSKKLADILNWEAGGMVLSTNEPLRRTAGISPAGVQHFRTQDIMQGKILPSSEEELWQQNRSKGAYA